MRTVQIDRGEYFAQFEWAWTSTWAFRAKVFEQIRTMHLVENDTDAVYPASFGQEAEFVLNITPFESNSRRIWAEFLTVD